MSTYFVGPTLTQNVVFQLKRLLHLNVASRDKLREAFGQTDDRRAQAAFSEMAEQHGRHATALQKLLWSHSEETHYQCSICGESADHLGARNQGMRQFGLSAILSESVTLEEHLQRRYLHALASIEGRAIRQLLYEQMSSVRAAGMRMLELRDLVREESPTEADG